MWLGRKYAEAFNVKDAEYLSIVEDLLILEGVKQMDKHIQHSDITTLEHTLCVSFIAFCVCKKLGLDYRAAARAGLLHDLVYYDWHEADPAHKYHGYRHPLFAVQNARALTELSEKDVDIIIHHMWPLTPIPPRYKEAWVVTFVDKYCATKETLRKYKKNPVNYRNE
ncbi:MAG: HDIG domain-containing protein [Clostridia bacterium]|nr:HDIG domain-containing protein [Clostridia bacterium]